MNPVLDCNEDLGTHGRPHPPHTQTHTHTPHRRIRPHTHARVDTHVHGRNGSEGGHRALRVLPTPSTTVGVTYYQLFNPRIPNGRRSWGVNVRRSTVGVGEGDPFVRDRTGPQTLPPGWSPRSMGVPVSEPATGNEGSKLLGPNSVLLPHASRTRVPSDF